jgi:hypothetical protein
MDKIRSGRLANRAQLNSDFWRHMRFSASYLGLATLLMVLTPVLAANSPSLAGHSDASPEVISQIRDMLDVLSPIYIQCAQATSVTAGALPDDLLPKAEQIQTPAQLVPAAKRSARYELWTIGGCGHTARIIIKLWYQDTGFETFLASPVEAPPLGVS